MKKIRLGLMGFGRIGRQIYKLVEQQEAFEVVAIIDVGNPDILHHLLTKTLGRDQHVELEKNYIVGAHGKSRLLPTDKPTEIPWDLFGVDFVIDATGRYLSSDQLQPHIDNGAGRVILSSLPESDIDRIVLMGVNDDSASPQDKIVSAGSASTMAAALALSTISKTHKLDHASMTSVHAYTSDQSLQDYAHSDYRRSRSGAENIIPNATPALRWIPQLLPAFKEKFSAYAMNVPVQVGSMLDLTLVFEDAQIAAQTVNELFIEAASQLPALIETINDPIVSSDVKGSDKSLLVDLRGTIKAGERIVKLLAWHETLGQAQRILDVAACYTKLDEGVTAQ